MGEGPRCLLFILKWFSNREVKIKQMWQKYSQMLPPSVGIQVFVTTFFPFSVGLNKDPQVKKLGKQKQILKIITGSLFTLCKS